SRQCHSGSTAVPSGNEEEVLSVTSPQISPPSAGGSSGAAEELASARLRAIVESSNDAIIGKTLGGTITDWNPSAERLYGYRADEVIGRSIQLLIPSDRADELAGILARVG